MNSKYRCLGCRTAQPAPPWRKMGLGGVCSEECFQEYRKPKKAKTGAAKVQGPGKNDIPLDVRKMVLRRDGVRCRWCGSTSVHLHHINYRSEGVDHSPHNLITLCPRHHEEVHRNKRKWKPILLGMIWMTYVQRRPVTVPQMERELKRCR